MADVSPRSSAAMSEEKRLPFAGYLFTHFHILQLLNHTEVYSFSL